MPSQGSVNISDRPSASVRAKLTAPGSLTIEIAGRLDSTSTGDIWRETHRELDRTSPRQVVIDASGIEYCDGSGIGLLFQLRRRLEKTGGVLEIHGLKAVFQQLLDLFDPFEFEEAPIIKPGPDSPVEEIGRSSFTFWQHLHALIEFMGEAGIALIQAFLKPGKVRWKDAFLLAETAGVNALPVIVLVGFLMGLIMAFQAAIPMRQFGAEIYVANLVGLSMVRELGPLMTAIVLAGRSGSAFAAELGTMKVNEEIDALITMGLDKANIGKIGEQAETLLAELRETNQRVARLFEDPKIASLLPDAAATMAAARRFAEDTQKPMSQLLEVFKDVSEGVKKLTVNLDSLSGDTAASVTQLKRILRRLDDLISDRQPDIEAALENIRLISENLREVTDNAKKYPSQFLFGEPPPRLKTGGDQ